MTRRRQPARRAAGLALALASVCAGLVVPSGAEAFDAVVSGTAPNKILTLTSDGASEITLSTVPSGELHVRAGGDPAEEIGADGCVASAAFAEPRADCGPAGDFAEIVVIGGPGADIVIWDEGSSRPAIPMRSTGAGGADVLGGGPGDDVLDGGPGEDTLLAAEGADLLRGGADRDVLEGGDGDDELIGGEGADAFDGGAGDDALDSFDGEVDGPLDCGAGADDRLFADNQLDLAASSGCETVAPEFASRPAVLGEAREGMTLAYAGAAVSGSPHALEFEWLRCDASCDDVESIPGATGPTYTVGRADVGARLVLVVRAVNAAGADEAASAPTDIVSPAPRPPAAPALPAVLAPAAAPVASSATPRPAVVRRRRPARVAVVRGRYRLDTGREAACPPGAGSCRVAVLVTLAGGRRTTPALVAGRRSVVIASGRSARLTVPLSKRAVRRLRASGRLRLTVTTTSSRGASAASVGRTTVSVRDPRRREGRAR